MVAATRVDRSFVENPLWVDSWLDLYWKKLTRKVGAKLMPVCKRDEWKALSCEPYGCGFWGCVIPTKTPGVVFKITKDVAEAQFVAAALSLGDIHPGIVRYDRIFEIGNPKRIEARTFAIWRQEASNPGKANECDAYEDEFESQDMVEGLVQLISQFEQSRSLRKVFDQLPEQELPDLLDTLAVADLDELLSDRGSSLFAVAYRLQFLTGHAKKMSKTKIFGHVGRAILHYLKAGFFSADVHVENIGEVADDSPLGFHLAITDPGLMVPLKRRWLSVKVPLLS